MVKSQQEGSISTAFFDVLIVGGGMVGAAFACALGDTSLRIGIIDANKPPQGPIEMEGANFDSRVSALTLASRHLLDNIGAWSFISALRHSPFERMSVWDAEGSGQIEFNASELGQVALGYIIENSVILAGLYQRLAQLENITIIAPSLIDGMTIDEGGLRCLHLTDGTEMKASLVIGADGAQSKVRELVGIGLKEKDYHQRAIVTTVKTELGHEATAWQRFLPSGPLAFLPLRTCQNDDHFCSIVWSVDESEVASLLAMDEMTFAAELGAAFEHRLGVIEAVANRQAFPLRQRHAKSYIQNGLALIGDAAHTIHPLAGQGVNLGLLDAAVLAEEILRALKRELPINDMSLLSRYQRRRVANNLVMMETMSLFKKLFGIRHPGVRWLRNNGMTLVNRFAPVKNHLAAQAMGLVGDLPALSRYKSGMKEGHSNKI